LGREPYGRFTLAIEVGELKLAIGFHELFKQVPHTLTSDERASEARSGVSWAPRSDFEGTGVLQVHVGRDAIWRERDHSIETQVGAIVLRIELEAAKLRALERRYEEQRRKWREEEAEQKRREQEAKHFRLLERDLEEMSEQAAKAERIRAFLAT